MRMRAQLSILVLVSVAGAQVRATAPPKSALLGSWEEDPGTCEGDNSVLYRGDGAFFGYDYEGRWVLEGATLRTAITKQMGSDEQWRPLGKPERSSTTIVSLTRSRLVERWKDGSLHHYHRCR
jgi:hypothetical protein